MSTLTDGGQVQSLEFSSIVAPMKGYQNCAMCDVVRVQDHTAVLSRLRW